MYLDVVYVHIIYYIRIVTSCKKIEVWQMNSGLMDVIRKLLILNPFYLYMHETSAERKQYATRLPVSALTHITRIRRDFDAANSPRYRAGFAPMLFQWCYSHMA